MREPPSKKGGEFFALLVCGLALLAWLKDWITKTDMRIDLDQYNNTTVFWQYIYNNLLHLWTSSLKVVSTIIINLVLKNLDTDHHYLIDKQGSNPFSKCKWWEIFVWYKKNSRKLFTLSEFIQTHLPSLNEVNSIDQIKLHWKSWWIYRPL